LYVNGKNPVQHGVEGRERMTQQAMPMNERNVRDAARICNHGMLTMTFL
jgi:hypothetical protein